MGNKIKFKRGSRSKLPQRLAYGEPAFVSDEGELYIGTESGNNIKLTSKSEINKINEQLDNITRLVNLIEGDTDNSILLNEEILKGGELHLPANKTFVFKNKSNINNAIRIIGKNTTLLFECNDGLNITSSNFYLEGVTIEQKNVDHNIEKNGLMIGKIVDGKYKYIQNHKLKDVKVKGFTTSIKMESTYWIELNDVETYKDKYGFLLNQDSSINNPTTTLKMDRVYFRGTGGANSAIVDSCGFSIKNVVNMSLNMCVSEWYENCGKMHTIQTCTFITPYFELCTNGINIHNITGNITFIEPYFNMLTNYGVKFDFGSVTFIGGRAIMSDNVPLISKGANSSLNFIKQINLTGGKMLDENGYQNQKVIIIDDGIQTSDTTINGLKCNNQGYRDTLYKFGGISTNLNNIPLNITIGSYDLGNFTTNGLEFNPNISVILRSPDLSQWKLIVDNSGNLTTTKI